MHLDALGKSSDPAAAVIAAATEVHRVLGPGHFTEFYREGLAIELGNRGVAFVKDAELPIFYRGECLGAVQPTDFLCGELVVAIVKETGEPEAAHVANWLRGSRREIGLLLEFNGPILKHKRIAYKRTTGESEMQRRQSVNIPVAG